MVGTTSGGLDGGVAIGPKTLDVVRVSTHVVDHDGRVWEGPSIPMDAQAKYAYHSRLGGIVPVEVAIDSIFANPPHYGGGGFEGMRLMRTPYGEGFLDMEHNLARLIYSSLAFNLSLVTQTMALLDDPSVDFVTHLQRTPREFFKGSQAAMRSDSGVTMIATVHHKDGSANDVLIPFDFVVKFGKDDRKMTMQEMRASTCSLALLNGLIREGEYANALELVMAGYFRPFFWVSGEDGLKVPTVYRNTDGQLVNKPMFFGIGTLPWGRYLPDAGYAAGLDALIGPYPRIDSAMPVGQKIAGNYVNSARNVNIALLLGFGEVLALNHNNQVVEGSAENLVFLFTNKRTGQMTAYCPPLSSNILAGTNRDRALKVLERGITLGGKKVELIMDAPSKKYVLKCLKGTANEELSALVLLGTGVGVIHTRSITDNPALRTWVECNELRSEESAATPLLLRRLRETEQRFMVNGGVRHPFVDAMQSALTNFALEHDGVRITPAYLMDWDVAAERVFGVSLDDVAGREFAAKANGGYFDQRVNGLQQPQELIGRYREAVQAIQKMARVSMDRRSKPFLPVRT